MYFVLVFRIRIWLPSSCYVAPPTSSSLPLSSSRSSSSSSSSLWCLFCPLCGPSACQLASQCWRYTTLLHSALLRSSRFSHFAYLILVANTIHNYSIASSIAVRIPRNTVKNTYVQRFLTSHTQFIWQLLVWVWVWVLHATATPVTVCSVSAYKAGVLLKAKYFRNNVRCVVYWKIKFLKVFKEIFWYI